MRKLLISISLLACSFAHCDEEKVYFPATVWYEEGQMFLFFGANLIIVDSWHYVPDEYLNRGIED